MAFSIFILLLCVAAIAFEARRIWLLRKALKRRETETNKTLTDRFEREMEETLGKWGKQ